MWVGARIIRWPEGTRAQKWPVREFTTAISIKTRTHDTPGPSVVKVKAVEPVPAPPRGEPFVPLRDDKSGALSEPGSRDRGDENRLAASLRVTTSYNNVYRGILTRAVVVFACLAGTAPLTQLAEVAAGKNINGGMPPNITAPPCRRKAPGKLFRPFVSYYYLLAAVESDARVKVYRPLFGLAVPPPRELCSPPCKCN